MASREEIPFGRRPIRPSDNEQVISQRQPSTHHDRHRMKQTEDLLASDLNQLSVQERAIALDDVHCVGEELKETPEMIEQCLQEFEQIVQQEKTPFYAIACQQNRSYVEDPSFRLKFLRANFHDVGPSVHQMMNFLRYKATYFGNDKVAQDITLDDLNEDDMALMLSNLYHVQDGRDRNGRVVVYLFNHMLGNCRPDTLIRVAYFIWFNIMIPLPEVQMKGLVSVYYDMTKPNEEKIQMPDVNFMTTILNFTACLPMRCSAMHICLKEGIGNLALNNAILGFSLKRLPVYTRVRTRLHYGSDIELQHHLRSHGFQAGSFPVDADGNFREDVEHVWFLRHHRDQELEGMVLEEANGILPIEEDARSPNARSLEDEQEVTAKCRAWMNDAGENEENMGAHAPDKGEQNQASGQPADDDVLLGRGKRIQYHPGNVSFRSFLANYSDDYDNAMRKERPRLCAHLVLVLRAKGVRFWQETEGGVWIESDAIEAQKKVGQLFRTIRKQKN